jgi:hypothetical protein
MKTVKRFSPIIGMLMILALMACATTGTTTKPLTAKQQAAVWMSIYNTTYDDTMAMAKNPKASPAQKEMVAKKKAILTKVWPLLKAYVAIIDAGGTPAAAQGTAITDLINELTNMAGG